MFPASVKEWFSIEGAKRMFDDTANHLESLEELGRSEETRQGYLRVATEIQAVVGWYVRLASAGFGVGLLTNLWELGHAVAADFETLATMPMISAMKRGE